MLQKRKGIQRKISAGLITVACVTLGTSLFLIFGTAHFVEEEHRQISDAVLRQSIQNIDATLEAVDRMTSEFMLDNDRINQFMMRDGLNGVEIYKMKQSLDRFYDSLVYRYGQSVSLYLHAPLTQRLYLDGAMYDFAGFANEGWRWSVLSLDNTDGWNYRDNMELYKGYQSFQKGSVFLNKRTYPLSSARSTGLVETLVGRDYLSAFLLESLPTEESQFYVFAQDGDVLLAVGEDWAAHAEETWAHLKGGRLFRLPSSPSYYAMSSSYTGWRYVVRIPKSGFISLYSPIGTLYALAVAVYCTAVSVYLVMLFLRPYRTIAQMVAQIRESMEDMEGPLQTDEFLYLRTGFLSLGQQVEGLKAQVESYRPAMCRQLIAELLQPGVVASYRDHCEKLLKAGMDFYEKGFCVAILHRPSQEEAPLDDLQVLKKLAPLRDELVRPLCANREDKAVVVLLTASQALTQAQARRYVDMYLQALEADPLCVGIGMVREDFAGIPVSYRAAQAALNRSLLLEGGVVEFHAAQYSGIVDASLLLVSKEIGAVLDVTKEEYPAHLPGLLAALFDKMGQLGFTKAMVYAVNGQLVFRGMELASKFDVHLDGLKAVYPLGTLHALDQARTTQEYIQIQSTVFQQLYTALEEKKAHAGSPKLAQRIVRYLNNHYTNADLSASVMVDEFSVTAEHISRVFKENMGVTLQAYLTGLRIGHAKRLLRENKGMSLAAVAEQVGYANQQTFTRAFKKETGVSPGAYRQGGEEERTDV